MAREPEPIVELRRVLGGQLATFRLAAGLTQGQLAKVALCDRTTLNHIEKGRARADELFWRAVDEACNAGGALLTAFLELETAKVQHEHRAREQQLAAVQTKVAALQGRATVQSQTANMPVLDDLRRAVLGHQVRSSTDNRTPVNAAQIEASIAQAHRLYQLADYDGAARLLPLVLNRAEATEPTAAAATPASTKAVAYLAAAKLASKIGDASLAWVAADRCLRFASEADRHGLVGIAKYQVACALLGAGHLDDAEQTAGTAAEYFASVATSTKPRIRREETLSVRGALLLLLAIMASRRGDSQATKINLRQAAELAERLGRDDNRLWTAFGPTNVAIHELSAYVALGDTKRAFQLGEVLDTDELPPVLRGRRSQVHLELGWASVGHGDDSLAVLHLLEAERVASQAVSRNATARELLTTLLARERKSATPGLRALATRAGIMQ